MIEQFFNEYNISEKELKDKIYNTYCELVRLKPEIWSSEVLELVKPDQPSNQILETLLNGSSEEIDRLQNSQRVTILDLLRLASFGIDTSLNDIHLEKLLLEQFFRRSIHKYYQLIFVFICSIIEEKQQNEIDFNRDLLFEILNKKVRNITESVEQLIAMIIVKELINNFDSDKNNNYKTEQINELMSALNDYVQEHCLTTAFSSIGNLPGEALIKYSNLVSFTEPLTSEKVKEIINSLKKYNNKASSQRLGIRQGGSRKREGFIWTDEHKIKFYEKVESLPKFKGKSIWDYAYKELDEKDFDKNIINYLRNETPLKNVPEKLFQEAIKTWSKYKDILSKPKPEEKPFAFKLKHALSLLNYPQTKLSTMKRYYGDGKKLFIFNTLKSENSK